MKKIVLIAFVAITTCNVYAQTKPVIKPVATKPNTVAVPKPVFKSLTDSFSYAVGFAIANNMKQQSVKNVNTTLLKKAMDDVFANQQPQIDAQLINSVLQKQSQIFAEQKAKDDEAKAQPELERGRTFLSSNKLRTSVTTLPDGLQYEVLKKADSTTVKPSPNDNVTVNYIGTLIDGKEFDNSFKRGQPATFQVTGVIKGWTEILQLMSVGDKWKVYIPNELAYGLHPRDPNTIPPGAALVFEITLEGIKKAETK